MVSAVGKRLDGGIAEPERIDRALMISSATGARLAVKVKRGESLAPAKCGRPLGWGVMGAHRAFLIELVEQDPDISLMELRDALADAEGVEVHYSTISYALRRFGFTYKTGFEIGIT